MGNKSKIRQMRLYHTQKPLYRKGNNRKSEQTSNRMWENICILLIHQRINIQDISATQKTQQKQPIQLWNRQRTSIDSTQKKIKWPTNMWKMLSITSHHGNANQTHNEISRYPCQNVAYPKDTEQQMLVRNRERGTLNCGWECKIVQSLWKIVWPFLKT